MVGRPVSRELPQYSVVEVTRLATEILDASEVMVEGIYWHLYGGMVNPVTVRFGGVWVMYFCGVEKPEPLFGKFIGPLPKPEV